MVHVPVKRLEMVRGNGLGVYRRLAGVVAAATQATGACVSRARENSGQAPRPASTAGGPDTLGVGPPPTVVDVHNAPAGWLLLAVPALNHQLNHPLTPGMGQAPKGVCT